MKEEDSFIIVKMIRFAVGEDSSLFVLRRSTSLLLLTRMAMDEYQDGSEDASMDEVMGIYISLSVSGNRSFSLFLSLSLSLSLSLFHACCH